MKNTDRFTGKAGAYAQGRPGYPSAVVKLLTQETRRENPRMADIGSGTGILSRAMLERGWTVYGVEPNDDMRKEAEKTLNGFSRFHSVAGTAEHTRLSGASVDLVTSAQAFHWFDRGRQDSPDLEFQGGRQPYCPGGRKHPSSLLPPFLRVQRGLGGIDGQYRSVFRPPLPGIPLSE